VDWSNHSEGGERSAVDWSNHSEGGERSAVDKSSCGEGGEMTTVDWSSTGKETVLRELLHSLVAVRLLQLCFNPPCSHAPLYMK